MKSPIREIPANSQKLASKHSSAVAYLYVNRSGQLCALGYAGKSTKHSFRNSFANSAQRLKYVGKWLQEEDGIEADKAIRKAEKKAESAKPHTLNVGDVLRSSWGYDQTNIDYYQVTALIGSRMVEIRKIGAMSEITGRDQGNCVPEKNTFVGDVMRKRVGLDGRSVRIESFAHAYKITPTIIAGVECFSASSWSSYA
jgi:hypothetical protein